LAQAVPGDSLRFERVTLEMAHAIYEAAEKRITAIAEAIAGA
jgi:allophanate hydrolase subunit 2